MANNTEAQRVHEFLHGIQLDQFYQRIVDKLHVTRLTHFAHVTDQDLDDLGMSKPEQRRLFEALKKSKKRPLFGSFRRRKSKTKIFSSEVEEPCHPKLSPMDTPLSNSSSLTCVIDEKDLILHQMLGTGAFGYVRKGEWIAHKSKRVDVAVKCLKISKDSAFLQLQLDFTKEANGMSRLDHPHIIKLYGVVLSTPIMLVTELAALGCLLTCLREENPKFLISQLCDFVIQVASGMSYLESQHYIHRDLAARNLLLSSYDTIKIGDFGLMRPLGTEEDYYTMNPKGKVPFAWCPPESLKFRKFSHASDMWSFGILLMELFSYGEEPWPGLNCSQILQKVDRPNLERPPKPSHCPSKIYNVAFNHCWAHDPAHRPTFSAIQNIMEQIRPQDVKAKRTFDSKTPQNLFFIEGDVVTLIEASTDASWWRGQNKRTGRVGMFPSDLVGGRSESSSPTIIRSASFVMNVQNPKSPEVSCRPGNPNCDCGENHVYDLPFVVSSPKRISQTRSIDSDLTLSTESGYSSSFSNRPNSENSRSQASYENFTGAPNYELMEPKVKTKPTRPPPVPGDDCKDEGSTTPVSKTNRTPTAEPLQDGPQEQVSKRWSSGDKPRSTGPFTLSRRVGAKKLKSFDIPVKRIDSISTPPSSNEISKNDSQLSLSAKHSPSSLRQKHKSSSPQTSPIRRSTSDDYQKSPSREIPRRFTRSCSSDIIRSKSLKEALQLVDSQRQTRIKVSDGIEARRSSSFTSSTGRAQERTEFCEHYECIPRSKSISVGDENHILCKSPQHDSFYENHEIINVIKKASPECKNEIIDLQHESSVLQNSLDATLSLEYEKMVFRQRNTENEGSFFDETSQKNAYYENVPFGYVENFVMIEHSDVPDEICTALSNLKCPSYENHGFEELTSLSKTGLDTQTNTCDPFVCEEYSCSLPNSCNWEICQKRLDKSGGLIIKIGKSIAPRMRKTSSDGNLKNDESYANIGNSDDYPVDSSQFKDKSKEAKCSVDITGELASILSSRISIKENVAITDDGIKLVETLDEIAFGTTKELSWSSLQEGDPEISKQINTNNSAGSDFPPLMHERQRHSSLRIAQTKGKNISYENVRKSDDSSPVNILEHELQKDKQDERLTYSTRPNVLSFENKLAAFSLPLSQQANSLIRKDHSEEEKVPALPPKKRFGLRTPERPSTSNYPRLSRDSSDLKLHIQDNLQRYRPCPSKGSPNYEYPQRDANEDDEIPPPLPKKYQNQVC